jgi:predicted DNA-binding transcriptional regulator AlpA
MQEKPKEFKRGNLEKALPGVLGYPYSLMIPETGFLRLPQVLNVYPVSKSTWWQMIREGKAPKPVKLSRRCAAWRFADIRALIEGRE